MGYATHLSMPPMPIKEIKIADENTAINQVDSAIAPNKMEIYFNGSVTILKEVIAQIPPDKKVSIADIS